MKEKVKSIITTLLSALIINGDNELRGRGLK
jgi:hypothetical protein